MTQIATIHLTGEVERSPSGKAYMLRFKTPTGSTIVPVAVSQSRIELGVLWIADWILSKKHEGIGRVLDLGFESLDGKVIPTEIPQVAEKALAGLNESAIKKGMFTVESDGEKHRTFRIKTSPRSGKTAIGLLTGQNNTTDYTWFGYIDGETIKFWHNASIGYGEYVPMPISKELAQECLNTILGNPKEAGLRFARESKKCSRCGKDLTHPESLDIGLGPECSGLGYGASKKKEAKQ